MSLIYRYFACVSALALAAPVFAQESSAAEAADDNASQPGEILVTAQKRSQAAQNVGIALSVQDSEALETRSVQKIGDVLIAVPSVQVNQTSDLVFFNFRGIGTSEFTTNLDSPIAVNVDEIYQSKSFMVGLLMFDINRVEALKGPQGTLYGRNATGGAVNFFTNDPTDTLQAGGKIGYDNYETLRLEGFVSGPLGENLSVRLAGTYVNQGQGFYKNDNIGGTDGRERKWALRGKLRWSGDNTTATLTGFYGQDNSIALPDEGVGLATPATALSGSPVFCPEYLNGTVTGATSNCRRTTDGGFPGDNDAFTTSNDQRARIRIRNYGAHLNIDHDLGWANLTSITSFTHAFRNWREDSDGTPIQTVDANYYNKIDQYTQELRLTGRQGAWDYVLGGFYEHDDYLSKDYIVIAGGAAGGPYSPFTQKIDALALFFHNQFAVTDNLNLIAGVRYSNEKVSVDGGTFIASGLIDPPGFPTTIGPVVATSDLIPDGGSHRDTSTTFKMGFEWTPLSNVGPIDHLLLYGHVSTGFRSGGYTADFVGSQAEMAALSPEKITAYEVGFKSNLFNRKLTLNGGLFQYNFTDAFVRVDSGTTIVSITKNAGSIKPWGAELEVNWRPVSGLRLGAAGGYLHSTIESDVISAGQSIRGNQTVNSPKWTVALDGQFDTPLTDGLNLTLGADANYRSSQFLETSNQPSTRESGYWLVGGRVGIETSDGRYSLAVWGKNLFDKQYRFYAHDLPAFGFLINLYGPPRTYGLTLSAKF